MRCLVKLRHMAKAYRLERRIYMDDAFLSAISTTGFPIAVSCYLLVRLQTTLEHFSSKLDELIVELRKGYYTASVHH